MLKAFAAQRGTHVSQINYYFDDQNLKLRKKKYALRIRIIDGKKVFCTLKYPAKGPRKGPRSLKVRFEHEVPMPLATAKAVLAGRKSITEVDMTPTRILKRRFGKNSLARIRPLGIIQTERTHVPVAKWLELEIDRCKVYGKAFYEVEVETSKPKKVDRAIKEILDLYGIPYLPTTRSKFARFLEEWKRRHR